MNVEDHHLNVKSLFDYGFAVTDDLIRDSVIDLFKLINWRPIEMDKRVYLKIKLKSLAQEAKYIRREERRTTGDLRFGLHQHRIFIVRAEARATLLAYGYLNGKSHKQIEPEYFKRIDWEKVKSMVKRYGNGEQIEGFEAFMKSQ